MVTKRDTKRSSQLVGNVGLYYACYELSKRGWNVLPTSRNARGVDIVAYSQDGKRTRMIQVKSLSKRAPVPFGNKGLSLIAEHVIICRRIFEERPEIYILKAGEVQKRIHIGISDVGESHWLQPKDYEEFKDRWSLIGRG
jgi:hypothetical protein